MEGKTIVVSGCHFWQEDFLVGKCSFGKFDIFYKIYIFIPVVSAVDMPNRKERQSQRASKLSM